MAGDRATGRAVRLAKIQHLLHNHPRGLTTKQIASLCGAGIRTIQRDIKTVESNLGMPLIKLGDDRYGIRDGYQLPVVSFSLYEAAALFLASRLVARQVDESNPHMLTALSKLGDMLPAELARPIGQSVRDIAVKPLNPGYVEVFEKVAVAWSRQRRIRITYQSLHSTETKDWLVEPYFIEMTGTGYSAYVIGQAECAERRGITTFKLDRIRKIELLRDTFKIPDEVDIGELLRSSWGVIWGEDVEVKLRFSPGVTRRVKESTWHRSQVIEDLPDGGCILTVTVGSTLEITPWIRGWGADVEVLAPESLRREFRAWASQLHKMYRK